MQTFIAFFCVLICLICIQQDTLSTDAKSLPTICPEIVTRSQWNARKSLEVDYAVIPVEYVIIQQTETPVCTTKNKCSSRVANIQAFHMEEFEFHDIGYNFLVGGDGRIYEGAGWHKVGAHTKGYNDNSLGLAFIGSFQDTAPSSKQIQTAKNFLKCATALGELDEEYRLYGARQLRPTDSPGLRLYREIQNWPHYSTVIPKR